MCVTPGLLEGVQTWLRVPGPRGSGSGESGVPGYVGTARGKAGCWCVTLGGRSEGYAGGPVVKRALVRHSWTISSEIHGFKFRARGNGGPDESGVPGYAGRSAMEAGPGIYLGVRPDGYVGGPVVKQGARASLRGSIAVNHQCLAAKVHGFKFSCPWQ